MRQVLAFFSKFVSQFAVLVAMACSHVFAQPSVGSGEESELFRQAIEKFRGASRVTIAEEDDSSFHRWEAPSSKTETGVILDWNADKLLLVRATDVKEKTVPSWRVLRIEPFWENSQAERLHELYAKQRWNDAIALGPKLFGSKSEQPTLPRWQQKMLLAELVECRSSIGNWEKGALLFRSLALAQDSVPPLLATVIPIPWADTTLGNSDRVRLQELSIGWIREQNEYVKLMGAAWLLDSAQQKEAMTTLEVLVKQSKNMLISKYAEAQLWRTLPPVELATKRLNRCYSLRDSLPLPFQAGPTMLLAERFNKGNEKELALNEWIRVAMMHSEQYRFASQAAKSGAELLRERSRNKEADALENPYRKLEP